MKEIVDRILKEEQEAQGRLIQARQDAERMVTQAKKEAQAAVERSAAETEEFVRKRRADTRQQLLLEKEKALADTRSQVSARAKSREKSIAAVAQSVFTRVMDIQP